MAIFNSYVKLPEGNFTTPQTKGVQHLMYFVQNYGTDLILTTIDD